MMARTKRIYILMIELNKLFLFFFVAVFLKEIEDMFSVFLSSYRNTRESLGELEKAVETLACGSCSHSISRFPKLSLVFLQLDRNTAHVFDFLNRGHNMPARGYEFYCFEKIKFVSTSGNLMFCLLYKHTNDGLFYDFSKISKHFPNISEDFRRYPRKIR